MAWLYLVGRILFALIFIGSGGFGHLGQLSGTAEYASAKGVPASRALVLLTGIMLLAGGLSVALGFWMEIGTWLLVVFLLVAAFAIHDFWSVSDPLQRQTEQAQFMKNLSMAGAAVILYWFVRNCGYGPLTLGTPMR